MESSTHQISLLDDCPYQGEAEKNSSMSNCSAGNVATLHPAFSTESGAITEQFLNVVRNLVPVIFGFIAVLGFIGNLLVIVIVISNQQMRSTTNILIISLAIADLLFIVVCVPFTAVMYAVPLWPFGTIFCKAYQYVIHVTAHASVYTLVLMSFDRYLAVVHPISSMVLRTKCNAYIAIGLSWFAICSCNLPMLFEFEVVDFDSSNSFCMNIKTMKDPDHEKVFYGCFFAFAFLLPLTAVSILYGFMIRRLLGCGRAAKARLASGKSSETMRAKRRVTKMVIVVVVIFAVCWLPLQIIFMIQSFGRYPGTAGWIAVKLAANCLAYMNSCVNPILYAFLSDNFRKSFRKLLGCFGDFQPLLKTGMEHTSIKDCVEPLRRSTTCTVERSSCL